MENVKTITVQLTERDLCVLINACDTAAKDYPNAVHRPKFTAMRERLEAFEREVCNVH